MSAWRRDRLVPSLVTGLLCWLIAGHAGAQTAPADTTGRPPGQASAFKLVATGLLAGAGGLAVGALAGAQLGADGTEFSGFEEAYYVGSGVGALFMAVGMEAANYGRGDAWLVTLTSLAVGAAGVGLVVATEETGAVPLTVAAQLTLTAMVERATAKRNARRTEAASLRPSGLATARSVSVGVVPGGFGVSMRGRF